MYTHMFRMYIHWLHYPIINHLMLIRLGCMFHTSINYFPIGKHITRYAWCRIGRATEGGAVPRTNETYCLQTGLS